MVVLKMLFIQFLVKKLSFYVWKSIISNKKIPTDDHKSWKETKNAYIESSLRNFASDFRQAVSDAPMQFWLGMSVCGEEVQGVFVDAFVSGLTYSEKLDEIDNFEIEKVFRKFGYDYKSKRAMLYCEIIEKKQDIIWSEYVLKMLKDIAENHQNPCIGEIEVKTDDDKDAHTVEMIEANLINSVRGVAAKAIGHILWNCKEFSKCF